LVLLDFEGEQVEIVHQRLDEISITWNTVDPAQPLDWAGEGFQLAWREGALSELAALKGQQLQAVELVEWAGEDMAHGTVAVGFVFPNDQVMIYNARASRSPVHVPQARRVADTAHTGTRLRQSVNGQLRVMRWAGAEERSPGPSIAPNPVQGSALIRRSPGQHLRVGVEQRDLVQNLLHGRLHV
ncbi:hypothetical protein, partial [Streptosporangium roseum]|uniref:hypothetical protein n=1 Tax=Streptosporangium roseum TaxID=2001 RepID=UPI001E29391D